MIKRPTSHPELDSRLTGLWRWLRLEVAMLDWTLHKWLGLYTHTAPQIRRVSRWHSALYRFTCVRCYVRTTASETEALALPVREFGTVCHVACENLTSATNILKHYWICLNRPRRFVTFCISALEILLLILTYLLAYVYCYAMRRVDIARGCQWPWITLNGQNIIRENATKISTIHAISCTM